MALKVRNIMADGTVRDSMKGVVVPADCEVYAVLAEIIRRKKNEHMGIVDRSALSAGVGDHVGDL